MLGAHPAAHLTLRAYSPSGPFIHLDNALIRSEIIALSRFIFLCKTFSYVFIFGAFTTIRAK